MSSSPAKSNKRPKRSSAASAASPLSSPADASASPAASSSSGRKRKSLDDVDDVDVDTVVPEEEEDDDDDAEEDRISPRGVADADKTPEEEEAEDGGGAAAAAAEEEEKEDDEEEEEKEDDEEEEENADAPVEDNDTKDQEQADAAADDDEEALEEEEEEEEDADEEEDDADGEDSAVVGSKSSSSLMGRRAINAEGRPPEAGVLAEVYCENFMCHQKLRVTFCRNVNFIHGQNGSGKSAILAAIQICLGASARRTNRARNLREMIKKDTDRAKVRVTLLNGGDDAYKAEVYGGKITVERSITAGGGYNGYKLLDEKGVEKSRSKKDLDEMLDRLNVQVENPVSVLDQEESKKFLTGKDEDKYKFFLKATELERIDRTFAATLETLDEMTDAHTKLEESLDVNKESTEALHKKWMQHKELDRLSNKVRTLEVKYGWSTYEEAEAKWEEGKQKMESFEEKAAERREALSQAEQAANQPQEKEQRMQGKIDELIAESNEQQDLKKQHEAELKKAAGPYKEVERQVQNVKRQKKDSSKNLSAAKRRLQEARDEMVKAAGSAESENSRRAVQLTTYETEIDQRREKADELKESVSSRVRAYEEVEPRLHDVKHKVKETQRKLDGANHTLRSMQQSGDEFAVFGPRVRQVFNMVEKAKQERKFRGPVVGPIGKYIKIAPGKERFAEMAELAIGNGSLDRFVVTNDHDRLLLQDIRNKARCQRDCGILQQKPAARYPVPAPPVDGIETVASVLSIAEDLVFNTLVDSARIDQMALANSKAESEQGLLVDNGRGSYSVRGGMKAVYFLPKGDHWFVKNGSRTINSNTTKVRRSIGVDKSAAIENAKRSVGEFQAELRQIESESNKLEGEHTRHQREWNKAKKAFQDNDTRISQLSSKIEELRSEIESCEDVTIDTSEYEQDVAQAEKEESDIKATELKLKEELENREPELEEIKARLDEVNIRMDKVQDDITKAEAEMSQFLVTQTQTQSAIEKKKKKLEQYEAARAKHEEYLADLTEKKAKALMDARKIHYRVQMRKENDQKKDQNEEGDPIPADDAANEPTEEQLEKIEPKPMDRGSEYYEAKIAKAEEKVQAERKRRKMSDEDANVAFEKYMRAKDIEESKQKQLNQLDAQIDEISRDVKGRRRKWNGLRKHLSDVTSVKFDNFLKLNQYEGSVGFIHGEGRLEIKVKKSTEQNEVETTDVKGLSGGERSFTTLCLLLALGEKLETPFRILDEFDVFLDTQSRRLVMQLLIHTAKLMKHRQFIFITPQDISGLKSDPMLRIHKLLPPVRHEVVGGPTQQTLDFSQSQS